MSAGTRAEKRLIKESAQKAPGKESPSPGLLPGTGADDTRHSANEHLKGRSRRSTPTSGKTGNQSASTVRAGIHSLRENLTTVASTPTYAFSGPGGRRAEEEANT